MANTKSAQKRMRGTARKEARNSAVKSGVRTRLKTFKTLAADGKKEEAAKAMTDAASALDKAAKRGTIHKRTANRRKSHMAKELNAVSA